MTNPPRKSIIESLPPPTERGAMRLWAPLLVVAILANGIAGGLQKHSDVSVARFCIMLLVGKTIATWSAWFFLGRRKLVDRASLPFVRACLIAAVCNGVAWAAYLYAVDHGPFAVVQTLTAGYGCVTVVLAVLFLRERLGLLQVAGVALVFGASAYVTYEADGASAGIARDWLLSSFLATVLWGANTVILRHAYCLPHADDIRPFVANWFGLVVTVLPFALFFAPNVETGADVRIAGLGVALYVAAELALYLAIGRGPASVVNTLGCLYPIPSFVFAAMVLGEPMTRAWIAGAIVIPGIVLVLPPEQNPLYRWLGTRRTG